MRIQDFFQTMTNAIAHCGVILSKTVISSAPS